MRTDCTIDNRAVYCPNATTLGFSRSKAKRGDCVTYKQHYKDGSYQTVLGRVMGRVSAPKLAHQDEEVEGWLLVLRLSDDGTHAYENWINPADVMQVYDVPTALLAFFAQPELPETHKLRRMIEGGYLSNGALVRGQTLESPAPKPGEKA